VFVWVWEYEVPADAVPAFRAAYSSHGDWAELFGRAAGYLGTELYHDPHGSGRFLTIDRWRTEQDWLAFRATFGVDYEALDARLAGLSARETSLFEGSSEEL
jgi:heme-degrading monooxygenase HmoA